MTEYEFFVSGTPEQQGSTRAFVRGGRAYITTTNKNLHSWRDLIRVVAQEYAGTVHTQAISITATFFMPKPKSAPKKKIRMTKRPDLDKLIRSVLDALTGTLYKDDSQVDVLCVEKRYADGTDPIGVRLHLIAEDEPEPRKRVQSVESRTSYL
jgi:Holliday junction resolvase RusA-like endonuclease